MTLAAGGNDYSVVNVAELRELRRTGNTLIAPLIALHPHKEPDCELLREVVAAESVAQMFVIIWSLRDMVRDWLDDIGAVDLHARSAVYASDPVQLEAAECWVNEQYNGLSGGNGKASVVQLLRVFTAAGYPLVTDSWLRAFFAAGGNFHEATRVAKLITEMQNGTQHRIAARYRPDILRVLQERATERQPRSPE